MVICLPLLLTFDSQTSLSSGHGRQSMFDLNELS
jgi:hypothetical protein